MEEEERRERLRILISFWVHHIRGSSQLSEDDRLVKGWISSPGAGSDGIDRSISQLYQIHQLEDRGQIWDNDEGAQNTYRSENESL